MTNTEVIQYIVLYFYRFFYSVVTLDGMIDRMLGSTMSFRSVEEQCLVPRLWFSWRKSSLQDRSDEISRQKNRNHKVGMPLLIF